MEKIQKEIDAKLETLLTEDQKRQLQAMRPGTPTIRAAGPGGPAGRVPPGGTPLFRAYRYAIDFPGFAGKILTPGKPLDQLQELEKKVAESKKRDGCLEPRWLAVLRARLNKAWDPDFQALQP